MAKLKGVTVTTVHSLLTPLESIDDKSEWPDHIFRQASFAHSALNEDLKTGIAIIENFEKHQAWEYLNQTRENFFRHQVHVEPQKLELIRAGYSLMRGECKTADEAIAALGHGGDRRSKEFQDCEYTILKKGTVAYFKARLKQDRPDLYTLVQLKRLSPNAAAEIAGWRKKPKAPTPLQQLWKAWAKATETERATFRATICNHP